VSRSRLSTTGCAILGLLALRPWSAYELTQQLHRGLRYTMPASERHLYAEPKRLAAAGLVRMRRETVGRRSRTIYEITPAGRDALRHQMATPPAPPQLQFEAMQRVMFADQGSKQDLLAALDTTSRQVQQLLDDGVQQLRGYQDDGGPFPERLRIIMLFARFYADYLLLLRDWVALARREVASWPTTSDLGLTDGTRRIFDDLLRLADQLTEDSEQASTGRAATEGSATAQGADGDGRPGSTAKKRKPSSANSMRSSSVADAASSRHSRDRR
jgi:DNA-binding PadR family transcriptional regulator